MLQNLVLRSASSRVSKDGAASGASWFETAQGRLLTMRGEKLFPRALVVNALGLAKRPLQRLGRHRLDARGDADRVLDKNRNLLGLACDSVAVPVFVTRFRKPRH